MLRGVALYIFDKLPSCDCRHPFKDAKECQIAIFKCLALLGLVCIASRGLIEIMDYMIKP